MIDKTEIKYRFKRSVESYEENAPVQRRIADHLFELLQGTGQNTGNRMWYRIADTQNKGYGWKWWFVCE